MKKFYRQILSILSISIFIHAPYNSCVAAEWEIVSWDGTGNYANTKQWRIVEPTEGTTYGDLIPGTDQTNNIGNTSYRVKNIYTYNFTVTSSQQFSSSTTAVSTITTSGSSLGVLFTATLGGATAATEGINLCALAPTGSTVLVQVCPATDNLLSWIGVASGSASTGSVVTIYNSGWVLALTTGTVSAGTALMTASTGAGYLKAVSVSSENVVGVALATGTAAGGLTRIRIR